MLSQLIYNSRATQPDRLEHDLPLVLQSACRNNARDGITGCLIVQDGAFLQFLEGPVPALDALLERLLADPRHGGLQVLVRARSEVRWFPYWDMHAMRDLTERLPPVAGLDGDAAVALFTRLSWEARADAMQGTLTLT